MRSVRVFVIALVALALSVVAVARPVSESVWPLSTGEKNFCTASSINEARHLWLTAAHCVDNDGPMLVMGDPIRVIVRDVVNDIAIVSTPRASAPALRLAKQAPQVQEELRMIGYPFGFPFQVTVRGWVAALSGVVWEGRPPYTLFQITAAPGNSGSAIVNKRGEVVSVLQVTADRMPERGEFAGMLGGALFDTLAKYRGYFEAR